MKNRLYFSNYDMLIRTLDFLFGENFVLLKIGRLIETKNNKTFFIYLLKK